MEAMLSYQPITLGDKEQALADLVRCYETVSYTHLSYMFRKILLIPRSNWKQNSTTPTKSFWIESAMKSLGTDE